MQKGLWVLTMLYTYQGLLVGLPAGGIQMLYAHNKDVGIFTMCLIPFSLKFLWSPILDYYFIEKIGKRKSYILPLHIIMSCLLFYLSTIELTLLNIFYVYFIITICISTSDTAIDGWQVTLLDNVAQGSVCQTFGQQGGWFFSQYIFILLQQHGILELKTYLIILAFLGLIVTFITYNIKEHNPIVVVAYTSIFEQIKQVKGLYQNKYIKSLCIILFFQRIGISFMDVAAPIILVRAGISKSLISQMAITNFICTIWIPLYIGKYISGKQKENRLTNLALIYQTINMALFGITLYEFKKNGYSSQYIIIFAIHLLIHEVFRKVFSVTLFSFICEIAEAQLAGMQISLMGSIHNISRVILDPLVLQSIAYANNYYILLGCVLYMGVTLRLFNDKFQNLQFIPKECWTLHDYVELKEIQLIKQ